MGEAGGLETVDEDALGALYVRSVGRAEALARALTGDPHLAQDVAHDAFIRVAGRFRHLRSPDAFDSYLRTAVVNLCRSYFRRRVVERRVLQRVGVGREAAPTHETEERDAMWAAILALPYRQRAAVVLRFYEDLSEQQTGEMLRCSPRAVNALVSRAMAALRQGIEEER